MRLPDGEPAPPDGALPPGVTAARPFGVYIHVPFCASRCGYCDFNTYVGMRQDGYADAVLAEWALAQRVLGGAPPADTVFVGGGTPTLLAPGDLAQILDAIPRADAAEVTVEANPETVDRARLSALRGRERRGSRSGCRAPSRTCSQHSTARTRPVRRPTPRGSRAWRGSRTCRST